MKIDIDPEGNPWNAPTTATGEMEARIRTLLGQAKVAREEAVELSTKAAQADQNATDLSRRADEYQAILDRLSRPEEGKWASGDFADSDMQKAWHDATKIAARDPRR